MTQRLFARGFVGISMTGAIPGYFLMRQAVTCVYVAHRSRKIMRCITGTKSLASDTFEPNNE